MQETQKMLVQSLGQEDPLEKEMANRSSVLGCKIPRTEAPGRLQSMGSQRVGCDWACIHTHAFIQRLINFCEIKCLVSYSAFLESKKRISLLVPPLPRLWLWGTFINSEFQGFFLVFPFHSVLRQLQCSGYPKSPPSLHSRVPPDFPSSTAICCPLLAPGGSTFLLLQWGREVCSLTLWWLCEPLKFKFCVSFLYRRENRFRGV